MPIFKRIKVITDSHIVTSNNIERTCDLLFNFLITTYCISMPCHHNQTIDIATIHRPYNFRNSHDVASA